MVWVSILGIVLCAALIFSFEWRKLRQKSGREKAGMLLLLGAGTALSILLVFYPDLPGPTPFLNSIFKPVSEWMLPP